MATLIIEDEISLLLSMLKQLEQFGEISFAKNFGEASKIIQGLSRLDLAVVDLQLPGPSGMDPDAGFKIIDKIYNLFPDTPIIIMTIRNDQASWELAKRFSSVRYYYTKPWHSEVLKKDAQACLNGLATEITLRGVIEEVQ